MNFNKDALLQELKNGISEEELAQRFANSLNEAAAAYAKQLNAQKNKLEEAKKVADFLNKYYPFLFSEKISNKEVIMLLDDIDKSISNFTMRPF